MFEAYFREYYLRLEIFTIIFLFIANSSYLVILFLGFINSYRMHQRSLIQGHRLQMMNNALKPISLLVPAYNEEVAIIDSVYSMLRLNYPLYEVIVVNDGSKDNTMAKLIDTFQLLELKMAAPVNIPTQEVLHVYKSPQFPNLTVIDKKNGGKSDALNCAINFSIYPLVCCVDSDGIFDEKGLLQVAIPFFEYPDEMVAVGGTIRVVNNVKVNAGKVEEAEISWNYLSLIQIVEYLRAFLVGRMGWDYINSNTIISGAFGLFRKESIIKVGGYTQHTIGEDLELLLKIHRYYRKNKIPYRISFLPDPICWTEVPTDLKTLGNQRIRWQQGLAEGLFKSRDMIFKPWAGTIGMIALPYLLFFELLAAPIEVLGYLIYIIGFTFNIFDIKLIILFFLVSMGYGLVLTVGAIVIEEFTFQKYKRIPDFFKLIIGAFLEQLGYRQLHLYYRTVGIIRFIRGKRSWGAMERKGLSKK